MDYYTLRILSNQFVRKLIDDAINETLPLQEFLGEHSDYDHIPFADQMDYLNRFEEALRRVV